MAEVLHEFAAGKAVVVAKKVYSILSRLSGVKFGKISNQAMHPYKNRWGKFLGVYGSGSDKKFYQLNFRLGKTDEITSFDVWPANILPVSKARKPIPPEYTLSLEGNGISRCVTMMIDFMDDPEQMSKVTRGLAEDSKDDENNVVIQFLTANPAFLDDFTSGRASADPKVAKKIFDAFVKVRPPNLKTNFVNTTALIRITKRVLKSNGGSLGVNPTAASAIPVAIAFPGQQGGVQVTTEDDWSIIPRGNELQRQFDALEKPQGALGILNQFKQALVDMYNTPSLGANMLIASGRGGVGKSYTVETTLGDLGLSEGTHYMIIKGSSSMRPSTFQSYLVSAADYVFVIIDDADKVMSSPEMANVLKTALEFNSKGQRIMRSLRKKAQPPNKQDPDALENFDEKNTPVQFQIIWCTNGDPVGRWKAKGWDDGDVGAVLTRSRVIPFNFTNEEVLDIIKTNLTSQSDTDDLVTPDLKLQLFTSMRNEAEQRTLKGQGSNWTGISFREFNMLIGYLWIHLSAKRPMAQFWKDYFFPVMKGTLALN